MKKAWRTVCMGISSIVAAETRGQAIARTLRCVLEANYRTKFQDIKAVRAPEHDEWAEVDESKHCWDEKLLPTSIRRADAYTDQSKW